MTTILIALWIAGITFKWYWIVAALVWDVIWITLKMNFLAILVRRVFEDVLPPGPPPS